MRLSEEEIREAWTKACLTRLPQKLFGMQPYLMNPIALLFLKKPYKIWFNEMDKLYGKSEEINED